MIVLQGISFGRILGAYIFIDYKKHKKKANMFFYFSRDHNSRGYLEIRMFIGIPIL